MCESHAFTYKDGKEELILENVDKLDIEGDTIKLETIMGLKKELQGKIKNIDFSKHKIVIE